MRKKAFFFLLFFLFLTIPALGQSLKVYHIGIGQGDCSLIIAKDINGNGENVTFSVLIDAGPLSETKGQELWTFVKAKLEENGADGLDYLIVSHLHFDHVAGITGVLKGILADDPDWINSLTIFDRLSFKNPYSDDEDDSADKCWDYSPTATTKNYNNLVTASFSRNRAPLLFGQDVFAPAQLQNIRMICVASNGCVNGTMFAKIRNNRPTQENDLSFAFLIRFNGFNYFTGGDTSGGGGGYADLETPIAYIFSPFPNFHACSLKVSHHGSAHSTNSNFLARMQPTLSVVPSGLRSFQGTKLPTKKTLDALTSAGSNLVYTFVPSTAGTYYTGTATSYQDVILSVDAPPGYNNPINMTVTTYTRDTSTFAITSAPATVTVQCAKPHDAYALPDTPMSCPATSSAWKSFVQKKAAPRRATRRRKP